MGEGGGKTSRRKVETNTPKSRKGEMEGDSERKKRKEGQRKGEGDGLEKF